MCGIIGQFNSHEKIDPEQFRAMRDLLHHRGPDDAGLYFNQEGNVAIGHRRLSFLDLTESGKQPMVSNDGSVVITFNGEIYNYRELRQELKGDYEMRTGTDTEVIIAGYQKWGIKVLDRLSGMFAFALYDSNLKRVYLVRDRFGIKPLYYSLNHETLLFASETKAMLASEKIERKMDISAFADFFVYRYIPSPKSIWQSVKKVEPAHYVQVDLQNYTNTNVEYWKLNLDNQTRLQSELIGDVDDLMLQSVKQHLIADVRIGAFLSGGYDSSALVYYAKRNNYNTDTFSIGFENWDESEHRYAKLVADHLSVKNMHTIAGKQDLELIDSMPQVYDEPIADISIIPTYMVSALANKNVKAVLSGEGADELFGGYNWQKQFYDLSNPTGFINRLKNRITPPDTVQFYAQSMAMGWFAKDELKALLVPELHQHINNDVHWFYRKHYNSTVSPLKSIQMLDIKCFMAELVLTKVDRASMANSLEVRVPFLDHRLFETVLSCSEKNYFKPDVTKFILHKNLNDHLPESILQRKKQGFVGPDSYYMDMNWYHQQLDDSTLLRSGMIQPEFVSDLFEKNDHWRLWKLTVMANWFGFYFG